MVGWRFLPTCRQWTNLEGISSAVGDFGIFTRNHQHSAADRFFLNYVLAKYVPPPTAYSQPPTAAHGARQPTAHGARQPTAYDPGQRIAHGSPRPTAQSRPRPTAGHGPRQLTAHGLRSGPRSTTHGPWLTAHGALPRTAAHGSPR